VQQGAQRGFFEANHGWFLFELNAKIRSVISVK